MGGHRGEPDIKFILHPDGGSTAFYIQFQVNLGGECDPARSIYYQVINPMSGF